MNDKKKMPVSGDSPSASMAAVLKSARMATAALPNNESWVLPPVEPYTMGLSNFPVSNGCRNPEVDGFDIVAFYGDWGTRGICEQLMTRKNPKEHKAATAEKFERWLVRAGFSKCERVWHTNVILVLRNGEYRPAKKSESGDHPLYHDYELMRRSAEINWLVERVCRPRLYVTLGVAAAVAFCHTHANADPENRFTKYSSNGSTSLRSFPLRTLYESPYQLPDGAVVVQLCHPELHHLSASARQEYHPSYSPDEMLREGLRIAGLFGR
jgi:hypothetical protein